MPKLDFDGLRAELHADIYGVLCKWLPGGRREANEYVVENPTRDDHKKGSFKINLRKGSWKDFATDDQGGDLISLYAYLKGVSNGEAYKMLSGDNVESMEVKRRRTKAKKKSIPDETFTPMPIGDDVPAMPKPKGYPERVSIYHDENGKPLMRVCMYRQKSTGNKTPVPTSWGRRVWPKMKKNAEGKEIFAGDMFDRVGWHNKAWPENRPLLNLHKLAEHSEYPVLIGEGEKVAERLQAVMGETHVCMTWPGGAKAVKKADFRPIFNRKVILCPDYDLPGQKAMLEVARILKAQQCKVSMIWEPLDEDRHLDGWDLADEPDNDKVKEFIENALGIDVVENILAEAAKINSGKDGLTINDSELYDSIPAQVLYNQKDLRCLGYDSENRVYFISRVRGVVTTLKPDQLGNKNHLFSLMPRHFWYDLFPNHEGGLDKDKASDTLQRWADDVGYFNRDVIRGCGVWHEDNGDFVFHMGQKLLVKEKLIPVNEYVSEYMYEATSDLRINFVKPLASDRAKEFLNICNWLEWDLPVFGHLLAGWCVIAPLCGGLEWRPHIWITGGAGTGKSTVMKEIVKRACGKVCLFVQGDSTAAGVRQKLGSDALPVVFDEFESETPQRQQEQQRILDLARGSSGQTHAKLVKGGAQGDPLEFEIRSCFAFSSINVNMTQHADKTRINLLTLKDPPAGLTKEEGDERYARFEEYIQGVEKTMTPDYVNGLLMRSYALLPVIRHNAKVFGRAISSKLNNRRAGDQIGILCAGAWSLSHSGQVTIEEAEAWCDQYDFEKVAPVGDAKDHDRCLAYILQTVVRFTKASGMVERTLGELVTVVHENDLSNDDSTTEANRVLMRHGLRVDRKLGTLAIANNHSQLERIMAKTPYQNWQHLLKRIEGSYPSGKSMRFGGTDVSHAMVLKLDVVMHKHEQIQSNDEAQKVVAPF